MLDGGIAMDVAISASHQAALRTGVFFLVTRNYSYLFAFFSKQFQLRETEVRGDVGYTASDCTSTASMHKGSK